MTSQVINFGCRLNSFEGEVIKDHLEKSAKEKVIVFNTCAVTKEAERQARQAIRKNRKKYPDAKIVVTGCAAQINPLIFANMPEVDQIIGNQEKLEKETYNFIGDSEYAKIMVNNIMSIKETASHLVQGLEGRARAYVQVQNGCNHRCTFCIIPYGRGNSRSVPIGEIVNQVRVLIENGYQEIVLTGVDITDYGLDLPGTPTLGSMIKRLLKLIPDLKRLRLSSIDVAEIDNDLLDLIATEPRLMPHLHLSLQSGDNIILKRMKRRHTREEVIIFANKVTSLRPDIALGADIITGFPTEDENHFENSVSIIHEANLTWLHVFPYSMREGTPAARIPSQVPANIRKERAEILRNIGKQKITKFLESRIGKTESIIIEKPGLGRTEHFAVVQCSPSLVSGTVTQCKIKGVEGELLCAA